MFVPVAASSILTQHDLQRFFLSNPTAVAVAAVLTVVATLKPERTHSGLACGGSSWRLREVMNAAMVQRSRENSKRELGKRR
jgi:hypothetical protein